MSHTILKFLSAGFVVMTILLVFWAAQEFISSKSLKLLLWIAVWLVVFAAAFAWLLSRLHLI